MDISIEEKFYELAKQWRYETGGYSILLTKLKHPLHKEIVNLGEDIIPFLLEDLKQYPKDWTYALKILTKQNPVKVEHHGNITLVAKDWIDWGKQQGYIKEI